MKNIKITKSLKTKEWILWIMKKRNPMDKLESKLTKTNPFSTILQSSLETYQMLWKIRKVA
jgi:hypothetical protein